MRVAGTSSKVPLSVRSKRMKSPASKPSASRTSSGKVVRPFLSRVRKVFAVAKEATEGEYHFPSSSGKSYRPHHPLENLIQPELRHPHEAGPGGSGEGAVVEPLAQPVRGVGGIALLQARSVLDRPAPVVALVDTHRKGEDERQAEGGKEGHLAGLGPQNVRLRQQSVEAGEVVVQTCCQEDLDAVAQAIVQPGLAHPLVELRGDLASHSRREAETDAVFFDQLSQAPEQRPGEVGLRAGAADGVGEERGLSFLIF